MKIGICSNAANYLSTWDERFSHLRSLGYEAVDHGLENINLDYYKDVEAMKDHCNQVREAAEKNGLIISQVHGPWPTDDKTEESRSIGWDCMHRAVYACYLLGCKNLVIHPQMPFGWGSDTDPDYAENLTVELIRELLPECEKYDVTVCLENMPFGAQRISTMKYIAEAVKKVNSPFAGICLDTGHCNCLNDDIAENVRLSAPYLKVLHVHDNKYSTDGHFIPFLGSIDWSAFAKALSDIGFDGVLSLESNNPDSKKMSPEVISAYEKLTVESAKQLKRMIEELKNA